MRNAPYAGFPKLAPSDLLGAWPCACIYLIGGPGVPQGKYLGKTSSPRLCPSSKVEAGAGIRVTKGDPPPTWSDRLAEFWRAPITSMALPGSMRGGRNHGLAAQPPSNLGRSAGVDGHVGVKAAALYEPPDRRRDFPWTALPRHVASWKLNRRACHARGRASQSRAKGLGSISSW
jgi:hypothetical protein